MRAVQRAAVYRYAMKSRLYNGVLLGMDAAAQFVHFTGRNLKLLAQAAGNGAVFKPRRRAVVARSHNLPVFTITAPTLRRKQVLRLLTTRAISIK